MSSDANAALLASLRANATKHLASGIGIEFTELTPDRVVATMPVDDRTRQPFGILHGGASLVLAETLASVGGSLNVDLREQNVVGLEINANHIRAKRSGTVTGTGTPLHRGRSTQIWEVRIVDEENRPICVSRCTLAVVPSLNASADKREP